MQLEVFDKATIDRYTTAGWWDDLTLAQRIAQHAQSRPHAPAFISDDRFVMSWCDYHQRSDQLGAGFATLGLERGDPIAFLLPDGPTAHVAYVAAEKAGLVGIGIGPRAGTREIAHLLTETGATTLLTMPTNREASAGAIATEIAQAGAPIARHLTVQHDGDTFSLHAADRAVPLPESSVARAMLAGRALSADELFFINSTSGTTGLPKCVMHTQNRWKYFHKKCTQFREDDVFMVVVPSPFGFGLWMAHFSPTMLGAPTVLTTEFDVDATIDAIERHRVTVLAAVTTQVLMMLRSPKLDRADLSSLRIVQSGGERVPFDPAADFEDRTGAKILQFYGSNEAGCVCGTTLEDDKRHRLGTAGRVFPEMHVRLFAEDGSDTTASGVGRSACKGPGITPGYYGNDDANASLFRADGWMYLGDIVQVDEGGYLSVVGRTADFIIRGGHNISAPAVEEELLAHPRVAMAAVVGMADPIIGERVCAYVVTKDLEEITLADVTAFLSARGVSKTMWPERLVCVRDLPQGSGGKVGKAALRADIAGRLEAEQTTGASEHAVTLRIEPATDADVALILRFIRGLAEYEHLSHECVATEEGLRATLFGARPAAEVLLAHWNDEPAGFALFFSSYSTFLAQPGMYLEDLFVEPALRGRGIGTALLARLAQLAEERCCGRLEWAVLDWNEPSIGFYRSLGAVPLDEWTTFRLAGDALSRLARGH